MPDYLYTAIGIITQGSSPKPLQKQAIEQGLLRSRRNVLISAPTNSGKTLVGYLVLLEALARGKRVVLLEPLRALAREKADELERHVQAIGKVIGRPFKVRVSTGDYRLENETFSDPPPGAELIIATPERLESILRIPENQAWFADLGAVCIDEAHMLSDPRRGGTLEYLITSLLMLPVPPRLVLLSATIASTEKVATWLQPCDVISSTARTPPLSKWLAELDEGEDANERIAVWLESQLAAPKTQALIFIHQARQTATTAQQLTHLLGDKAGPAGALAYHAKMSPAQREAVRAQFVRGESRVVVTTSALAMGVNLPATHVVVRDLTFIGTRSPGVTELVQMMGRAGRGNDPGTAIVLKRASDRWTTSDLVKSLQLEILPPLTSALVAAERSQATNAPPAAQAVASLLARAGESGHSVEEVVAFFARSFGGAAIAPQVPTTLHWLTTSALAFQDKTTGRHKLTSLGMATVHAVLPLRLGASFAQLIRDLLALEDDKKTLGRWTPLDFLVVLELLCDDTPSLKRFSVDLTDQVTTWCEQHPQLVPMLFRRWLRGNKGHSNAAEVLGSLGIASREAGVDHDEWARQRGVLATFNAIVLYERAIGRSVADLQRQYGITHLEGVEERWRDTILWLLGGLSELLNIKVFYFHLKEDCAANHERTKLVKRQFDKMQHQAFALIEQIKYASPLGELVLAMRRRQAGRAGVGIASLRLLEQAGITQLAQLAKLTPDQLKAYGLRKDVIERIVKHFRAISV